MNIESLVEPCLQQIWQVSALVVVVGIVAPFVGRRRPHFAYLLWLLVFLKCITPPLMSSPASVFSWLQQTQATTSISDAPWHELTATPIVDHAMPVATETTPQPTEIAEVSSPAQPSTPIHWQTIAFFAWLSGAVLFGGYLSVQWTRMTRIIRRNSLLPTCVQDERVAEVFAATAKSLGLTRPPKLVVVSEPMGPAAMGFLRPTIVVPAELTNLATDAELQSIFTHELTHIRRGDVGVAWLQAAASCIWWFHPLVWYANRQIVRWREAAVDEGVIAQLSISPRKYADALLCVLESRVRPFPAMQVGMAVGESTQTRLVRLMKQTNPCRRTPLWCWAGAVLLGLAVLPGGAFSVPQQADFTIAADDDVEKEDGTPEVTGSLQLVGNDGSGPADNPVLREDLAIEIQTPGKQQSEIAEINVAHIKDGKQLTLHKATPIAGNKFLTPKMKFVFDRSNPGLQSVFIMGRSKDGAVAWKEWRVIGGNHIELQEGGWDDSFTAMLDGQFIPEGGIPQRKPLQADLRFAKEYVVIAGDVRHDIGTATANATVTVTAFSTGSPQVAGLPVPSQPMGVVNSPAAILPASMQLTTKTDANGTWRLGKLAKGLNVKVSVSLPNKVTTMTNIVADTKPTQISIPQSRDTSIKVVDATTGEPVRNVRILSSLPIGENSVATSVGATSEQGQVRLNLALGKNGISLQPIGDTAAKNYPTVVSTTVDATTGSLQLKMDSASRIEFLVVDDETGNPFPFVAVQPTRDSKLDHQIDSAGIKRGVMLVTCKSGKAKFHLPGLAYRGYEVLNPISEPLELLPRTTKQYTFRVRKQKEYRLPVDDDDTTSFSQEHQAAVKKLRALGAQVRSDGNPEQGHCAVSLTQFWKGKAEDLSVLKDLQQLQHLMCMAYPVPKEFQTETKPQAPLITDDYLKAFGKAKDVISILIHRDHITDKGLAHLAGCEKLQNIVLNDTAIRGEGFESLSELPISALMAVGRNLDFENVDLSKMKMLNQLTLKNSTDVALIPRKAGRGLVLANISPANQGTFNRLNEYESVRYVYFGGQTVTDEMLKHPLFQRIESLQIPKDCKVTNDGLANLIDNNSKLAALILEGRHFTNDAVPYLIELSGLKALVLRDVSITDAGLEKLKEANPKLNIQSTGAQYQYFAQPD